MKNQIFLGLFFLKFSILANGQEISSGYQHVEIVETVKPIETLVNDEKVNNDYETRVLQNSYILNRHQDSVYYAGVVNNIDQLDSVLFVMKKTVKKNEQTLYIIKKGLAVDSVHIRFEPETKTVEVNGQDHYVLNAAYFKALQQPVRVSITDFIGLIDDFLGDYPYQLNYLQSIASVGKYKADNGYRILNATVRTKRSQSDIEDYWNVHYKYKKAGLLQEVIKKGADGISFEKKLLGVKDELIRYKTIRNQESRVIEEKEISFNIRNTCAYIERRIHFNTALVKETISELKRYDCKFTEIKTF